MSRGRSQRHQWSSWWRGVSAERRIKLLVCDDHPVVRFGLIGLLRSQDDFEIVAEARNGAEAIELVGRYRPDVVIMDLQMPEVDGTTATEGIVRL